MIAEIKPSEKGYIAQFERQLNHTVKDVWAMLADNAQIEKWFNELSVGELRYGGFMKFDMQDEISEELEITDFKMFSVLAFDWFGDEVRFEIHPEQDGCLLILKEKINTLTEQTKKDLAGWHVCLDIIKVLLDGETIQRQEEWKIWYEAYGRVIEELKL